jgi:hypothetical protein
VFEIQDDKGSEIIEEFYYFNELERSQNNSNLPCIKSSMTQEIKRSVKALN